MAIFFGKIATKVNPEQYEKGYYQTNRPEMFNGIEIGDFAYIIANGKIQLWKAREWSENNRLDFDILVLDLRINTKDLVALKCFRLSVPFIIYTVRQARNVAFYPITTTETFSLADISNTDYYKDDNLYRKTIVRENRTDVQEDSDDVQFYFEKDKINVFKAPFMEDSLFKNFTDNRNKIGNGRPNKDSTLSKFNAIMRFPHEFNRNDESLLRIYDAFAVAYNDKDKVQDDDEEEEIIITEKPSRMDRTKQPLNLILFGPPGTGKTHKLKDYFAAFTDVSIPLSKEAYLQQQIEKMSWWQVIAAALLDKNNVNVPELVNHEFIKIKAALSANNNLNAILWGQLQAHTIRESETVNFANRSEPLIFNKLEGSIWHLLPDIAKTDIPDIIEIVATYKNYNSRATQTKVERYSMVTFHQSFGYEEFIEGIKPVLGNEAIETTLRYELGDGRFYEACLKALRLAGFNSFEEYEKTDAASRNAKIAAAPPYLFVIDEINRANISKVFGELITLIEDSKRLGSTDELMLSLPSGRRFGVPKNLYLIGTMNTADRSIALLDIALRRRFAFKEMPPKPELLTTTISDAPMISLKDMLTKMNERIEYLLDKDHTIGHAFFINVKTFEDLYNVIYNSIIPLLQEYFYGEWDKIALVLGDNDEWKKAKTDRIIWKRELINGKILFGVGDFEDKELYFVNDSLSVNSIVHIYQKP